MKKKQLFFLVSVLLMFPKFSIYAQLGLGGSGSSSLTDDLRITVRDEDISTTRQTSNREASLQASTQDASPNIMLARSSTDYMVTPGDVYTLAYSAGSTPISYTITVDTSYRVRVSNLGIINGTGKTFPQIRREVENLVASNYPLSGVQLALTQPSVFMVTVNGEVHRVGERSAWALNRLSWLVDGNLTQYASTRDIAIKSANGQTKVYDLFKAQRLGDMSQNPYLRPGDVITFKRINRNVTINGAVERPGTYQIMNGENLQELVSFYGNGYTPVADRTRIRHVRYVDSKEISGDITYLSSEDLAGNYVLRDMDIISVPAITDLRPAVYVNRIERRITISGAVRRPGTYELMPNENMKELIEVYGNGLTQLADTTRATLTRYIDSNEISGDITLLTEQEVTGDYALQHLDVIAIPNITDLRPAVQVNRVERTITISGAVRRPGTFNIMQHENLHELIEVYGDGFTAVADPSRMEMVRLVNGEYIAGDKIYLTENDVKNNFLLEHYDMIFVPSITQLRPVMFVEGAVKDIVDDKAKDKGMEEASANLVASNRLAVQFDMGDTYASIVRSHRTWFTAISDTQNAYIIRNEERIPINLNLMLYDASYRGERLVVENDILVVPFRQYFVTVAGAVVNPGRYPYIPDRDWEYYIGLAGGFIPGRNSLQSIGMTDITGKRMRKTDAITPETVITARTNHGLFFFNQYAPVITTALSIVTTFISVILITTR